MKIFNYDHFPSGKWRKTLVCMRLQLVILVCSVSTLAASPSYSQERSLNVSYENILMVSVLSDLETQTGYQFMYFDDVIPKNTRVTFSAKNATVEQVLNEILTKKGFSYTINNNVVVIKSARTNITQQQPQQRRLQGTVKDEDGKALAGVTIRLRNSPRGTTSDANGYFVLDFPQEEGIVIVVSYIGKKAVEIKYTGQTVENVVMQDAVEAMDEVMVTGYQTISKERATGSYGSLNSAQIGRMTSMDLAQALEGMIAGVVKRPNDNSITIRGESTLLIDGMDSPLFVIDGFPVEGTLGVIRNNTVSYSMPNINPEIIENITVLKDAAAASIYGAKAGNGVIVITTKKAKRGQLQLSFSADLQVNPGIDYDYLKYRSASQYIDMQWDFMDKNPKLQDEAQKAAEIKRFRNGNFFPGPSLELMLKYYDGTLSRDEAEKQLAQYRSNDIPLLDDVLDQLARTSLTQRYTLSVGKATEGSNTMLTATFTNNRNRTKNNFGESLSINLRNSFDITKWLTADLTADINYGNSKHTEVSAEPSSYAWELYPYSRLVDDSGNPVYYYRSGVSPNNVANYEKYAEYLQPIGYSPLDELDKNIARSKDFITRVSGSLNFKFTDWLRFSSGFFYEHGQNDVIKLYNKESYSMRMFYNYYTYKDWLTEEIDHKVPYGDSREITARNTDNYTWRNQFNFNHTTANGMHSFVGLAGTEVREVKGEYQMNRVYGYDPELLTWAHLSDRDLTEGVSGLLGTWMSMDAMDFHAENQTVNHFVSIFGNAAYTLMNRYDVTGSIRWDKSNFFGTNKKYQNRPLWSVGAAWNMQEETFMREIKWIDRLKLRTTYGINGIIAMNASPYLVADYNVYSYNPVTDRVYGDIKSPPNASLRWEKVRVTNLGLDFAALGNRLSGVVDIYWKKSTDLLIDTDFEPTFGFSKATINAGNMSNRGIELTLNGVILHNSDWRWTAGFTFAHNKNKVTKTFIKPTRASSIVSGYLMEGYTYNSMFSYKFAGINENGDPMVYDYDENGNEIMVWDKDVTNIDAVVFSGSTTPIYSGGFNTNLNWKGVELNVHFVYNGGHKMRQPTVDPHISGTQGPSTLMSDDYKNVWQQAGDENKSGVMPRITYSYDPNTTYRNTYWRYADTNVVSASYIKLRSVTLSYNLPQSLLAKTFFKSIRLRAQMNNLFCISAYGHGIDPEAYSLSSGMRSSKAKPSYTFSVNFSF